MNKQIIRKFITNLYKWQWQSLLLLLVAFTHYLMAFQFGDKSGVIDTWWINAVLDIGYIIPGSLIVSIILNKIFQSKNIAFCENLVGNEGYKPAIDGLRAIAVLVVIFYHAGFKLFSGGFIGVDVFFVISGYLITGHILSQLQKGNFTFSAFYEKRIRRILPALSVTLLATIIIGSWMFDTKMMQEMAWSGVAAITSWANILFMSQSGYFNADSHTKLLLHTWSLSIEEQFYFLLPLYLFGLHKFIPNQYKRANSVISIAFIIFMVSAINTFTNQESAFYSIQSRAWELLTGALINYLPKVHLTTKKLLWYSITALGLILLPVIFYSTATPFPGFAALPPVLGTAFLIYSIGENKTIVQRILKLPAFTFIGRISYSLYLWHWPLLVLYRFYNIYPFGWQEYGLWLIVTFCVSTLSWQFIETPFRSRNFITKPYVFGYGLSTIILLGAGCFLVYQNTQLIQKFLRPNVIYPDEKVWDSDFEKWKNCVLPIGEFNINEVNLCVIGDKNIKPSFLLIGDSHAQVLAQGVAKIASQYGRSGLLLVTPGRPPFFEVTSTSVKRAVVTKGHITDLILGYPIEFVIISSYWTAAYEGCDLKTTGKDELFVDLFFDKCQQSKYLFTKGVIDLAEYFEKNKIKLNIVTQIPSYSFNVPNRVISTLFRGLDVEQTCDIRYNDFTASTKSVSEIFNQLVSSYPEVTLIHPEKILCDGFSCFSTLNNKPLYRDGDHLSTTGSIYISELFLPAFQN
jgi:peptidoglycan/LPS O-acetylase OafA/YrhL